MGLQCFWKLQIMLQASGGRPKMREHMQTLPMTISHSKGESTFCCAWIKTSYAAIDRFMETEFKDVWKWAYLPGERKQEGADMTLKIWVESWQGTSCNIKAARREDSVADRVNLDLPPKTKIDAASLVVTWIWLSLTVLLNYLAGHVSFGCNSSSKAAWSVLLIYKL